MASNSSNPGTFLSEEEKLKKLQTYQEAAAKRYEDRLAKMEQRKSTNTQQRPEETSSFFWTEFNSQQSAIESLFEQIPQAQEPNSIIKVDLFVSKNIFILNYCFIRKFLFKLSINVRQNLIHHFA